MPDEEDVDVDDHVHRLAARRGRGAGRGSGSPQPPPAWCPPGRPSPRLGDETCDLHREREGTQAVRRHRDHQCDDQ